MEFWFIHACIDATTSRVEFVTTRWVGCTQMVNKHRIRKRRRGGGGGGGWTFWKQIKKKKQQRKKSEQLEGSKLFTCTYCCSCFLHIIKKRTHTARWTFTTGYSWTKENGNKKTNKYNTWKNYTLQSAQYLINFYHWALRKKKNKTWHHSLKKNMCLQTLYEHLQAATQKCR